MKSGFKSVHFISAAVAVLLPRFASASDFSVESEDLVPVSKQVVAAIQKNDPDMAGLCHFKGKRIDLSDQNSALNFIVTTEDACNWGASAGPVWIVKENGKDYDVVLSFTTYSVKLEKVKNNGLHNIITSRGTASEYEIEYWSYFDRQYKKIHSYSFRGDDKKTCLAYKDICPWQFE